MPKIIVQCFIVFLCGLATADNVPVLIWGSNIQWVHLDNPNLFFFKFYVYNNFDLWSILKFRYEPAIALQHLDRSDFIDKISNVSTPDTIVVVVGEDEVSVLSNKVFTT